MNDPARLALMIEAIGNIEEFLSSVESYELFVQNKVLCHAVIYNLQCIGESVYKLSRKYVIVVGEGGVTTENHAGGSAGAGSRVVDHEAGHLALESVGKGNAATTGEFFRFHILHGITEGLLFTGDTQSGDNHLVQEFTVFAEGYVNGLAIEHNLYRFVTKWHPYRQHSCLLHQNKEHHHNGQSHAAIGPRSKCRCRHVRRSTYPGPR